MGIDPKANTVGSSNGVKMKPKANNRENCTHPVPSNSWGIFAMHSLDNRPLPEADIKKIFEGPIALVQPELKQELGKIEDEGSLPV